MGEIVKLVRIDWWFTRKRKEMREGIIESRVYALLPFFTTICMQIRCWICIHLITCMWRYHERMPLPPNSSSQSHINARWAMLSPAIKQAFTSWPWLLDLNIHVRVVLFPPSAAELSWLVCWLRPCWHAYYCRFTPNLPFLISQNEQLCFLFVLLLILTCSAYGFFFTKLQCI